MYSSAVSSTWCGSHSNGINRRCWPLLREGMTPVIGEIGGAGGGGGGGRLDGFAVCTHRFLLCRRFDSPGPPSLLSLTLFLFLFFQVCYSTA